MHSAFTGIGELIINSTLLAIKLHIACTGVLFLNSTHSVVTVHSAREGTGVLIVNTTRLALLVHSTCKKVLFS